MAAIACNRVLRRAASTANATTTTADVAIVGAGIWGMNTAYQLKRRQPELNIQVFEQAPALGYGSSGYSTGFLRAYYSFDETMQLALDGIDAYKKVSSPFRFSPCLLCLRVLCGGRGSALGPDPRPILAGIARGEGRSLSASHLLICEVFSLSVVLAVG